MKKPIAILLTLALLIALPALAENALETAARSVQDASTLDAQLVLLYDISLEHAGALEVGGWNCSLTCDPAQPLPHHHQIIRKYSDLSNPILSTTHPPPQSKHSSLYLL